MFFKLLDNADNRIDRRRFIVELKSLKRYKNVFSFELFDLFGFNVKNGSDFRVGAIVLIESLVKYSPKKIALKNA